MLDEQAALRSAEWTGTFAAFKYSLHNLPTRQNARQFIINHPFDWHGYVPHIWPPVRLDNRQHMCEFIRPCQYSKAREHFLLQCLSSLSIPQERSNSSAFITNNACSILFNLKTCGYLQTAKQIISIANESNVTYDIFRLSDPAGHPKLERVLWDGIPKILSVNDCTLSLYFLVLWCFSFLFGFPA